MLRMNLEQMFNIFLFVQSETEWQHYLRQSLEVVAKVAELLPTQAFRLLVRIYFVH